MADSNMPVMPEINQEICILCGECVSRCPHGALSLSPERVVLEEALCSYCGDCEGVCPEGAIALPYDIVFLPGEGEGEA